MRKIVVGIDNGVSGSIGILSVDSNEDLDKFLPIPTTSAQDYTKAKKNITRINFTELNSIIGTLPLHNSSMEVYIERPLVNPMMFRATGSALRALEAVLICIEGFNLPYHFVDSKEWQKKVLPEGCKETTELKKASRDIGIRYYPQFRNVIMKQGDADGLLIAHYFRERIRG